MYDVSAQGVDERIIYGHYYYYYASMKMVKPVETQHNHQGQAWQRPYVEPWQ